ncbi:UvrD-helicase domain-containing protein [Anabaena azotica]|uniref:DNA 3'-5' helicase n=1 Tax=Anabaena azotica FACHB-119 TaxID=947527 RepID=A0ABR8DBJ8_9NOST|nr:UvrD-helicase domain-containing protein [Anabaena azotica]MBD2503936.1 ATP-dependent helicase [Anabaena azotica FACHB-119]
MARGNPNPKTDHLPKQKTIWNNLPTELGRYPQVFKENISTYARALDGQCSPFEAIIPLLDKLSKDELEQIKLAIECLSSANTTQESQKQENSPPTVERSLQVTESSHSLKSEIAVYTANKDTTELNPVEIEELRSKYGFLPSKYQLGIIEWVLSGKGNGCCNAVAGSGKSTTLLIVAKALWQAGFKPNDIKICVFGKNNSNHLIKKFGPLWKSSISTLHSAAFSLVRRELNVKHSEEITVSKLKYQRIAQSLDLIPKRGLKVGRLWAENIISNDDDFLKLIDLVRLSHQQPTAEVVNAIAAHHEIETVQQPQLVAQWIARCLQIGEEWAITQKKLDFTDQIWLAVKWRLHERPWFKPYRFVLVDECQDLNPLQLTFVLSLIGNIGRILGVGDPQQSIFGYAGADNQSYYNLVRLTQAAELPLSICYRCPRSHIALVKKIFPHIPIEPAPDAIEGVIHQIEEKGVENFLQNGDVIISRKNAPLVSLCIKLIGLGMKANVLGRDVGDSLKKELDLIAKLPGYSFQFFNDAIAQYQAVKLERYRDLDNEDELRQKLLDKLEAILTIYQSHTAATSIENLKSYIDEIFSDEKSAITLSNIHKFKGGEGERIVIYKPKDVPMTWRNQLAWQEEQERNLLYVALTRSKRELFIVGEANWFN